MKSGPGNPVVVIGAGASGHLAARALIRAGSPAVVLVERDRSWSVGPAYATRDPQHLLNVAGSKLSVDSDCPHDFVTWATRRAPETSERVFLPRSLYGEYLRDALQAAARATRSSTLTRVTGEVVAVRPADRRDGSDVRAEVVLADGRVIGANDVVLGLGNPPPRPLPADCDGVIQDPWSACVPGRVHPDDTVVVVGSGLTAVDVVLTLAARGHRGRLCLVSRHGLLPRAHDLSSARPTPLVDRDAIVSARSAVAWMRAAIDDADGDWRAVFDAVRHDTNAIWQRLPERERDRLLRHAGRRWEVSRHRMAPEVATRMGELVATGRVTMRVGTVTAVERGAHGKNRVQLQPSRAQASTISANWVVNCSGADFDLRRSETPLVRSLLASGIARPGPLGSGFDVCGAGALLDELGRPSSVVSVVGPLRRGVEWETTAIPDIRRHVEELAPLIATRGRRRMSAAEVPSR
jgi:uncharacterized NAD(P)/FAD-binding protein YdhS